MKKSYFVEILLSLFFLFAVSVTAQEPAPASSEAKPADERLQVEKAEQNRPVTSGLKIEKKITGRLPNGYKEIVTNTQRDEIYNIQKEYLELVELLKLRIELLEKESNKKIDALLTPEQVEKLKASGSLVSEKVRQKKVAAPKRVESAK